MDRTVLTHAGDVATCLGVFASHVLFHGEPFIGERRGPNGLSPQQSVMLGHWLSASHDVTSADSSPPAAAQRARVCD